MVSFKHLSGYEARYASNWDTISEKSKLLIGGYCSYPGCWSRRRVQTHHAVYRDLHGAVAGREYPGIHVFPLCEYHHGRSNLNAAHHSANWNAGFEPPPTLDACNTAQYRTFLRAGWLAKREWMKGRGFP